MFAFVCAGLILPVEAYAIQLMVEYVTGIELRYFNSFVFAAAMSIYLTKSAPDKEINIIDIGYSKIILGTIKRLITVGLCIIVII